MNPNDLAQIEIGKNWYESLIQNSQNVKVPNDFAFLTRRMQQLKCSDTLLLVKRTAHLSVLLRYILGSFYIINLLVRSQFIRNKISQKKFSIWDSSIDPHVTDQEFMGFLESKQVITLDGGFFFVNSSNSKLRNSTEAFCINPLYDIIKFLDISFLDSLTLCKDLFHNFFTYLNVSLKSPDAIGLFKDFLIEPIIKLYKKKGLDKFYRTISSINMQEFWCESIDFNTVLYSTNSRAFQFKNLPFESMPEHPYFTFAHWGTVWTWDQSSAEWLKKVNAKKINIVGPILLSPLPVQSKAHNPIPKKLLVFDVTPHEALPIEGYNYYSEACCTKFISDILEVSNEDWEICLKPKRKFNSNHSKKFIKFLEQSEKKFKNFKVLSPKSNLFDEIQNATIVISIPFTSPFCIAKYLNIPAVYYDASGDLDFKAMGYDESDYVSNIHDLKARIADL